MNAKATVSNADVYMRLSEVPCYTYVVVRDSAKILLVGGYGKAMCLQDGSTYTLMDSTFFVRPLPPGTKIEITV